MKKEDKSPIDVGNGEFTCFDKCAFFAVFATFLSFSTLILLLSHSVQLISLSDSSLALWCVHCFIMLALSVSTSLRFLRAD